MTDHDSAQRLVLALLLASHPRLLSAADVPGQLPEVPRVRGALRVLVEDGLATRLGDLVGASRSAVRFRALSGAQYALGSIGGAAASGLESEPGG